MSTYSIRNGDTLSAIAARFNTSVSALAKANHISNPNKIFAGQKLTVPGKSDGFDSKPASRPASSGGGSAPQASAAARGPVKDGDGRKFPTSRDGTPMYRQGDPQWGGRRLGTSSSLAAAGCAMTATSMAVSKITGKVINPGEMDQYLDTHGGYAGNGLIWGKAAQMGGLGAAKQSWNLDTINKQIDKGRPVVIGVDYKAGSNGGANGTDHWITVTGRGREGGKNVYYANDPATGKQITLNQVGNRLVGGPKSYKSTGQLVTFSGGNPNPGTAPKPSTPTKPSTPSKPEPKPSTSVKGAAVPGGDLKRGAQGAAVKQLQAALVKAGNMTQKEMNTGPGVFGPRTESALKEFQKAHNVPATGYYGPLTRKAFEKLGAKVGGSSGGGTTTGTGGVKPADPGPVKGGVSLQQLKKVMPNLSDAKARQVLPHLNKAMQEAQINTPKRQAAFLAQLAHESGELRYFEEIASGAAYEGRKDLGNTQPGDGVRFKGRGPIQLTGRANYRAAGKALGIDLEHNPKRAADIDVGFRTAAWFWNSRGLNKYADAGNFREVTRRINGGYNGLSSREAYYRRALNVLG
ncbi:LysM peptidoglycan-binding domain-containing protein [Hyalangium minutum]|uniref:Membrane-bound lytic murein transglycosylase D n=1 Tax=Hyalangium minutum TaxID=394096 RepID=A0A085WN14_9BACT|nr:LysM peptidoglycan-binding domain-containing protein [Hyalangium minutum]KFE69077.1 Membrane-bound lytic murein transglycosylase D precursor [Hyalangium minutum]